MVGETGSIGVSSTRGFGELHSQQTNPDTGIKACVLDVSFLSNLTNVISRFPSLSPDTDKAGQRDCFQGRNVITVARG